MSTIETDDAAVTALVRDMLRRDHAGRSGWATYLRTLGAAVQTELGSKPRMGETRGRVRAVTLTDAIAALGTVHARFYAIVMREIDPGLDAKERNAQSNFARSATSTMKSAFRAGLNPLTMLVPSLTKEGLREWVREKSPATVDSIETRVQRLMRKVGRLIGELPEAEQDGAFTAAHNTLTGIEVGGAPRMRKVPQARRKGTNGHERRLTAGPHTRPRVSSQPESRIAA